MAYCPDCGLQALSRGVCSNCQEELYILNEQGEYFDEPHSDEFLEEAGKQRRYLDRREALKDQLQ